MNCALTAFSFSLKMLKCHVIFSFWRQGVYVSVCMYVYVGGLLMFKLESCLKFIYIVGVMVQTFNSSTQEAESDRFV